MNSWAKFKTLHATNFYHVIYHCNTLFFHKNNFTGTRGSFLRKSFTNMVANIDIDALKIQRQLRLITGKKN